MIGEAIKGTLIIAREGGLPVCSFNYEKKGDDFKLKKESLIKADLSSLSALLTSIKDFSSVALGSSVGEVIILFGNKPITIQFFQEGDLTYFKIGNELTNIKDIISKKKSVKFDKAITSMIDEEAMIPLEFQGKELMSKVNEAFDRRINAFTGIDELRKEGIINGRESKISIKSLWSNKKNLNVINGPRVIASLYLTAHLLKEELKEARVESVDEIAEQADDFFDEIKNELTHKLSDEFSGDFVLLTQFFLVNLLKIYEKRVRLKRLTINEFKDLLIKEEFKDEFRSVLNKKLFGNPNENNKFELLINLLNLISIMVNNITNKRVVDVFISLNNKVLNFRNNV